MMRRTTKLWLLAAGALVLAGYILFAGTMAALGWDFSNLSFRAMEKTLKTLRFRGFFFAQTRSFPLCFPLTGWMQPFLCSETGLPCGSQNPVSCALSRGRKRPA